MNEIIVIGDIHGSYKTFMKLIEQFPKGVEFVCVGDLIDRGPRSREVVQYCIDNKIKSVRGNHEQMMIEYINDTADPKYKGMWSAFEQNGGSQTLDSYEDSKGNLDKELINKHVSWMESLPIYLEFPEVKDQDGRYLVVSHSSIGKVWPWAKEKREQQKSIFEEVVLWGRDAPKDAKGIYNIIGHTPKEDPIVKSFYSNVDTGCCFIGRGSYGKLTAISYPSRKIYQQENIEHEEET